MARNRKTKASQTDSNTQVNENTETDMAADLDAIEAALSGEDAVVQLDAKPETLEIPEQTDAAPEEIDENDVAAALDAEEMRDEAYASQTSEVDVKDPPEKSASSSKGGNKGVVGRKMQFADAIRAIHAQDPIVLDSDEGELSEQAVEDLIASVKQVKVQEKVVNLLQAVLHGVKMSTYTKQALDVVRAAYLDSCKPVTSGEIKAVYEAAGYKGGTVGAQSGQMMVLFTVLGLTKRTDRSTLVPNENSVLLSILTS